MRSLITHHLKESGGILPRLDCEVRTGSATDRVRRGKLRPKTGVRPAILAIRNYEIVLIRNRWRA